jgi:hypothetical protein
MKKETNKQRVLRYIRDYGSISSMEAFRDLGITRLSAVIYNLKAEGHKIQTQQEGVVNRYGEKVYFARYSLAD